MSAMARYTDRSSSGGAHLTLRLPTGPGAQALDRFRIRRRAEASASADTRTLIASGKATVVRRSFTRRQPAFFGPPEGGHDVQPENTVACAVCPQARGLR
jgi:hypothetical protein